MQYTPLRFIVEPIEVTFAEPPRFEKVPHCPDSFVWHGETYTIEETLRQWLDYGRRGRMATNMRPTHAATAARRGSWGVGRFYFRVRVAGGRIFDIYYDRAPLHADDRKGNWFVYRELAEAAD